jgi:transcription antitermination factor NusG
VENLLLSRAGEALSQNSINIAPAAIPEGHGWPSDCSANWFAAYTTPRHERRIAERLCLRQIEHFLPLYTTQHRWRNGLKAVIDLPLFPSYLFVHIGRSERVRVLEIPGVLSIVGYGREPAPVPNTYIKWLREGLRARKIEPHPYLVVGEKVRIKTGAMAGMEGVLIRKKNNYRVVLTLDLIVRSVAVEVDAEDLEPVRPLPSRAVFSSCAATA